MVSASCVLEWLGEARGLSRSPSNNGPEFLVQFRWRVQDTMTTPKFDAHFSVLTDCNWISCHIVGGVVKPLASNDIEIPTVPPATDNASFLINEQDLSQVHCVMQALLRTRNDT